eukprot:3452799-Rhodomonas_salina.1
MALGVSGALKKCGAMVCVSFAIQGTCVSKKPNPTQQLFTPAGTDLAYAAMRCTAVPSTDPAYAARRCPVLTLSTVRRFSYELWRYLPPLQDVSSAICLRARYAMCGTELGSARVWCYVICGTELAYGAMRRVVLSEGWCYAMRGTERGYGGSVWWDAMSGTKLVYA